MPIINRAIPPMQNFVERIRTGKVVPVISHEALADLVLGGRQQLVAGYADYIQYPLADRDNLLKMAKYVSINNATWDDWALKADYLNFVKNLVYTQAQTNGAATTLLEEAAAEIDSLTLSVFAERLGYPRFEHGLDDPLLILAGLPLPIYITTSYHDFIEAALRRAGKEPHSEVCRWHRGLDSIRSVFVNNYEPSTTEPLVFHLLGRDDRPDSLVLTEDDYLQLIMAIAQENGKATDAIPDRVRRAMADSALMILGYDIAGWAFRVLFWGLIKPSPVKQTGFFSLQVAPDEKEKKYLQDYLKYETRFEVFWGDIVEYTKQLRQLWKG
jgi:hypothetical protein